MKMLSVILIFLFFLPLDLLAQNVGIGISTPQARLHIKGNADTSQLVIDANITQSNLRPLIRLRNAAGIDLLHIHSDDTSNTFIGKSAGAMNTPVSTASGKGNSFIGAGAGYSNTTGYDNTATGYRALYYNITAYRNTAYGKQALYSNTYGNFNSANGMFALALNTIGIYRPGQCC
ncbi:MAG: hypothetical protein ABIY51_10635 [Ferruginibacter sp.]